MSAEKLWLNSIGQLIQCANGKMALTGECPCGNVLCTSFHCISGWGARDDDSYTSAFKITYRLRIVPPNGISCMPDYWVYQGIVVYAGESTTGNWIKEMYEAAEELGYIESLCYFKMYDNESTGKRYGLFRDPVVLRTYDSVVDGGAESSFIAPSLASPKPGAFKFQTVAEGSGDLYSYSKHIRYHD